MSIVCRIPLKYFKPIFIPGVEALLWKVTSDPINVRWNHILRLLGMWSSFKISVENFSFEFLDGT